MNFEEIWQAIGKDPILGRDKSMRLYNELLNTVAVPGMLAEIGAYKGQTAKLLRLAMPGKTLHVYDTFTGVVASKPGVDYHKDGEFGDTSLAAVQALVGSDDVVYHVGMFPDTFTEQNCAFSFVHSDTDTYFGTLASLHAMVPLLSIGGRIVFDDYKWKNCPGVEKAIHEFLQTNKIPVSTHEWQHQFVLTRLEKMPTDITKYEYRTGAQHGEDGIIAHILSKIGTTNKFCVEFGIHITEGNTLEMKKQGWNCLWMDGGGDGQVIKRERITAENINDLFKKYNVPPEFDLLSIDIDSNDYWVWKALQGYSPRVVVIEYNSKVPPTESLSIAYNPNYVWPGDDYMGASLLAMCKCGEAKGYTLIGCESSGTNAFFVRNDLIEGNFEKRSIAELYRPPQYGQVVNGKYTGHPASRNKMIPV